MTSTLQDKLMHLPTGPGCYFMKDAEGAIIYVGKAKDLKARVNSYFRDNDQAVKTRALVARIRDFDIILTKTEGEALLLERTLIKHHKPHFNILLQDDKEFPLIRIDLRSDWPRFQKVRRRKDDGSTYLGPYSSASSLRSAMQLMYRVFPLIRCSPHEFANARRPCNYYHMKLCLGPCTLPVPRERYLDMVGDAIAFLEGKDHQLVARIRERMAHAAQREDFEIAATLRDQLQGLAEIGERQAVVFDKDINADALGLFADGEKFAVHVIHIENGKVVGGKNYIFNTGIHGREEDLCEFLIQYYEKATVPEWLLLPPNILSPSTAMLITEALQPSAPKGRLTIHEPQRGSQAQAVAMATKNATFAFEEDRREFGQKQAALAAVQETLGLPQIPHRIECIDISNFQNDSIVASNVVFIGGKPAKNLYRHYTIETVTDAPDDFASMQEVVGRRLERGLRDGDLPDLLVVDGGKGQLGAALAARKQCALPALIIVGLAKSRTESDRPRKFSEGPSYSAERVFLEDRLDPIPLEVGSPTFRVLTHLRDEAHRFAIGFHRKRRDKKLLTSGLSTVPGIGPALRKRTMELFGDLDGMKRASLDELRAVKGMKEATAVALHSYLRSLDKDSPASEPTNKP